MFQKKRGFILLRLGAMFNILVGVFGLLFSIGFAMLVIGLSGSGTPSMSDYFEIARMVGFIGIAGILCCCSGVILWRSSPSVQKSALVLLGCALGFCLAYCIEVVVALNGEIDPFDEEIVMMVFIPASLLLLGAIEFEFLRRKSKHIA